MPIPATPALLWGASLANTWTWPGPPDSPVSTSPLAGAAFEADSGTRDFWRVRRDEVLRCTVRYIPRTLTNGVTGWTTAATGVREALAWLAEQNVGRFLPDKAVPGTFHDVYLLEYRESLERGGVFYRVELVLRDVNATPFTFA